MTNTDITSLTPDLPIYANARHFLRILDGVQTFAQLVECMPQSLTWD
jgi:hypothetical protein